MKCLGNLSLRNNNSLRSQLGTLVGFPGDGYSINLRYTGLGLDQAVDEFRLFARDGHALFGQHRLELDDGVLITINTSIVMSDKFSV